MCLACAFWLKFNDSEVKSLRARTSIGWGHTDLEQGSKRQKRHWHRIITITHPKSLDCMVRSILEEFCKNNLIGIWKEDATVLPVPCTDTNCGNYGRYTPIRIFEALSSHLSNAVRRLRASKSGIPVPHASWCGQLSELFRALTKWALISITSKRAANCLRDLFDLFFFTSSSIQAF